MRFDLSRKWTAAVAGLAAAVSLGFSATTADASAASLAASGRAALSRLYASSPEARRAARRSHAVLVFPNIYKGGLGVGAQTGNGVLFVRGRPDSFYNLSAVSFGLQIGGQKFSYALFFMNDKAIDYVRKTAGFAVGSDPNIVVVNVGAQATPNSTTLRDDVDAFPFGAKGLMAGIDIQGSKITHIHPD